MPFITSEKVVRAYMAALNMECKHINSFKIDLGVDGFPTATIVRILTTEDLVRMGVEVDKTQDA